MKGLKIFSLFICISFAVLSGSEALAQDSDLKSYNLDGSQALVAYQYFTATEGAPVSSGQSSRKKSQECNPARDNSENYRIGTDYRPGHFGGSCFVTITGELTKCIPPSTLETTTYHAGWVLEGTCDEIRDLIEASF